jgi:hypothetical protein
VTFTDDLRPSRMTIRGRKVATAPGKALNRGRSIQQLGGTVNSPLGFGRRGSTHFTLMVHGFKPYGLGYLERVCGMLAGYKNKAVQQLHSA